MPAISTLATVARAALVSGGSISSSEHNTWSTAVKTGVNNLNSVVADLENNYASASAPTDKPAGKHWWDSGNSLMKYYATTNGTPKIFVEQDLAQTLTNKTLTTPILTTPKISGLIDAATWPSFSAWQTGAQNINSNAATKLKFDTKEFDTNTNYDAITNFRFTPTVAGYYLLTASVSIGVTATDTSVQVQVRLYKNGSLYKSGVTPPFFDPVLSDTNWNVPVSAIVNANGTTDYFEIFLLQINSSAAARAVNVQQDATYFMGCRIA